MKETGGTQVRDRTCLFWKSVIPYLGMTNFLEQASSISVLHHSRDIHPTWIKVTSPTDKTIRLVTWVLSAKSNEDLGSS